MSDIQGNRPEDSTNDAAATTPQASGAVVPPAPPAAPPLPVQGHAQPAAWPAVQGAPQAPRAGAPAAYPPYGQPVGYGAPRPQGYAAQPAAPYGSAFAAPQQSQTQPTLPLGPTQSAGQPTGAVPTAEKRKSGAGRVVGLLVAAALVGGAAGLGGAYAGVNLFASEASSPAAGPTTVTVNNPDSVNQTTAIAAKVLPSVVTIEASSGSNGGTGSGVVLSADGYVVTNTHVVTLDGATGDATIRVTTSDGRVFGAEVVGTDPTYDLAVIKLQDASGLTPVTFGDSAKLNVGDQTVAIGAPLGLANTVTTGIVSALNRSIEIASSAAPEAQGDDQDEQSPQAPGQGGPFFFDFGQGGQQQPQRQTAETIKIAVIQTDAAINPGNSGGALVNAAGELIGINVAIATAGGSSGESGSIGVGFSIPSSIVKRISDEIIADGSATHGLLGANVQSAAFVEGATITGAYIADVTAGGAAAQAGLRQGDVVTAFNGTPISDSVDLTAQVRAVPAGSKATVTFVRDGRTQSVDVNLGTLGAQ